jgi:uncharacterized protein (DUF1697 family)
MPHYVAFLRAINVAGHARVSMETVRALFADAGATGVRTYIQSGNVLFESRASNAPTIAAEAQRLLGECCGERPAVMLRSARDLEALVGSSPFAACGAAAADKLYVVFLSVRPRRRRSLPAVSAAEGLEAFALHGRDLLLVSKRKKSGFYGMPNIFVEQTFGVAATSRNWSTVQKIAQLLREMQ